MSDAFMTGTIQCSIDSHIATIYFAHPKQNSFPRHLLQDLHQVFLSLAKNTEVYVIVLTSDRDKAFCAGASFDELLQIKTPEEGKTFFMGFANVINSMRNCPQPIIGRIHGRAIGGGVGLVSACDYAIATSEASIKLSEIAIGIGPFVISPAVKRKIGTAALSELSLTAHDWKSADWAHQHGLFAELCDDTICLQHQVSDLAHRIASYAPMAVSELKKALWLGTENWDDLLEHNATISGRLVLSEITQKTLLKLKQK